MKISYSHHGKEMVRTIANETVLIGRGDGTDAPDLDLSPDTFVSRKHALLTTQHRALWIEDLGSKLGTTVNGKEIKGQGECRLRPDDVIVIGDTTLRVELTPEPPPPAPPDPASAEADAANDFHIDVGKRNDNPPAASK
ncbi:MAG: FHA domain-containing protein [Verrucomicrobia bacterium]|nr:FHA domain-containing protein [Verrucomicrobiota bacterium]